jgi:hypothetical protein
MADESKNKESKLKSKVDEELWKEFDLALKDRQDWDLEQADYYTMRYKGLGRPKLPYPNAPDVHYPLIDTIIEKLKPFYIQQIYAPSTLATFVQYPDEALEDTDAEKKFDYEVKQRSNFELEIQRVIDKMLQCGTGLMKQLWDSDEDKLDYYSVDPNFVIVPSNTEGIQSSDWFIHVLHFSEGAYRRKDDFKQGEDFVKTLKGKGGHSYDERIRLKNQREGITYHASDNMIVLWEIYTRVKDGEGWEYDTISPVLGWDKGVVRETMEVPYSHNQLPFCEFRLELAEPGFYSARGVPALLKAHELSLDKFWNYLLQYLDFSAMPTYDNDGTSVINSTNLAKEPGLILPPGITQSETIKAPVDFQEQMQMTRALAEDRIQVPDLSSSQHLAGQRGARGDVTATQISAIVGQSNQGNDMRSRIFKLQTAISFRQSWSLLTDYKYTEYKGKTHILMPSGSADSWDKAARSAQAMSLFQMLAGDPNAQHGALVKYLLENNGSDLVKKLYQDAPAPPPPPPASPLEQVEAMAKLLTAMSNVTRVGVPLSRDDYSSVLTSIGLPPLPEGPGGHIGMVPAGPPAPHQLQHAEAKANLLADHLPEPGSAAEGLSSAADLVSKVGPLAAPEFDAGGGEGGESPAGGQAMTPMAGGGVVGETEPGMTKGRSSKGKDGSTKIPMTISIPAQPQPPAPVVNVAPPEVNIPEWPEFPKIPAPVVNVSPPDVHVAPANVTVNVPEPKNTIVIDTIQRDKDGKITGAKISRKK